MFVKVAPLCPFKKQSSFGVTFVELLQIRNVVLSEFRDMKKNERK